MRLQKALSSFCALISETRTEALSASEMKSLCSEYSHIFLELNLADKSVDYDEQSTNVTLLQNNTFPWNGPANREAFLPLFNRFSCLVLGEVPSTELLRILHLHLTPKRSAGVASLMEKGSIILGEKIQTLNNIGELIDKLSLHIERQETPIRQRAYDMRQIISSMLFEAFGAAANKGASYPTVDFQCSANREKIAFNLRFPCGNIPVNDLKKMILDGQSVAWHLSWLSSDFFLVTIHEQFQELEVSAIVYPGNRNTATEFRSLLFNRYEKSGKAENLLIAPKQYTFSLISEIKNLAPDEEKTDYHVTITSLQQELDANTLPESVQQEMSRLERDKRKMEDQLTKKDAKISEITNRLNLANKELAEKRNELQRIGKDAGGADQLKQQIAILEKRLAFTSQAGGGPPSKEKQAEDAGMMHELQKLEASLKVTEKERLQIADKLVQEQKKLAVYEQKYAAVFKELNLRDKEILDLKGAIVKLRKESKDDAGPGGGGNRELLAKIKEYEAKEYSAKQEMRKWVLRAETAEKNVRIIQTDAAERIKTIEKRFETARANEVDLWKKIEELTAQLKKSSKAA